MILDLWEWETMVGGEFLVVSGEKNSVHLEYVARVYCDCGLWMDLRSNCGVHAIEKCMKTG